MVEQQSILAWQVLPAATGDEDMEDAFNGPAVVGPRSPRVGWERHEGTDDQNRALARRKPQDFGPGGQALPA
jgi:hypothetical protein